MRKYSLLNLIAGSGCLGVLLIVVMFVAVMAVATQKLLSPFQNVCAPANGPGPEQLSNAPKPSPTTTGPSALPAAYTVGPDTEPLDAGTMRNVALAPGNSANTIPSNYLKLYKAASADPRFGGIPWYVLAGIGKVETDHGRSNLPGVHSGENYAGAGGPMQFLQGTWNAYAIDGPGSNGKPNGTKDRYDPADAIFTAANYLHASGAPTKTRKAIYAYNHSWDYVDLVLSWAKKYGGNDFSPDDPNNAGMACGALDNAASPLGKRIIDYARRWLGKPYVWGGGNINGPTSGGFDCSGLTLYAVYHATGGQITIPRTSQEQQKDRRGKPVSRSQLQPGDLVFFSSPIGTPPHHVGIYIGGGRMVHAPHTGDVVKEAPMDWKEFNGGLRFSMTAKA
jgi:cell wall-associated NlpC family hydrolase